MREPWRRDTRGRKPTHQLGAPLSVTVIGATLVCLAILCSTPVCAQCPDGTWSLYVDSSGVEGNVNSCVKQFIASVPWATANSACVSLGNRAHLLTSSQVREWPCIIRSAFVICALRSPTHQLATPSFQREVVSKTHALSGLRQF